MKAGNSSPGETVSAEINLSISGRPLHLEITAPTGPTRPSRMLPVFRSISESFTNFAVNRAREEGLQVSCKKGCGACCRQLVPISEADARRLSEVVNEMPEPERSDVIARFEMAKQRVREAGLLEKLQSPDQITEQDYKSVGLEYFHLGAACPFLLEESCSIHSERPLVCREYLVVSTPENCTRQTGNPVEVLNMPGQVSKAVRRLGDKDDGRTDRWVPLILALDWVKEQSEEITLPGTVMIEDLLSELANRKQASSEK
jgi:Fe-S-cluster containining protein